MNTARRDVLVHGVIAGSIGYAVVAILFALLNLMQGQPIFATAAQLGTWIMGRGVVAPGVPTEPGSVLAFNGVHLLLMLGAGMVASLLVTVWERHPRAGFLPFFAFVASVIAVLLGSVALLSGLLRTVPAFDIVWVNIVAVYVVVWYLFASHPLLRDHFAEFGGDD